MKTETQTQETETLVDYIRRRARLAKADYEDAKTAFTDDFATNPTSAIEWKANAMVATQWRFVFWQQIVEAAGMEPVLEVARSTDAEIIEFAAERCRREIEGFFGSSSTCPWHSAARRAEAEVAAALLRRDVVEMRRLDSTDRNA